MQHADIEAAVRIDGVAYFTAAQVAEAANVTRQTLWRWRRAGKVPAGQRYRDGQILFSSAEAASVLSFATRLEPVAPQSTHEQGGEG